MPLACRAILACAFAALSAAAWAASNASEEELRALRARIEKLQRDLTAAEETRGEAADQLKASEKAMSEAQRALFALSRDRRSIEAQLESVATREREARSAQAEQEALAGRLLRLQYRQGAPDRLRLILEGRDAASVARHMAYYGYIQRARAALIGELRRQGESLAELEREAVARRAELAQNESAQQEENSRLQKERAARAAVVARISGDIAKGRREIGRLKRDEERLARLVDRIARALAAPATPGKGRRIDRVPDASVSAQPFERLKGRLQLPVKGELTNQYGAAREEGATWKGLFIRSVSGETIHAVADGRVVYADWLRGFGNLLILDHGKGYMSLYANNEGLLSQVGEKVRGGDPIARVGASGGQSDSGLYFELRRDGKPFDPLKWVAP
ncbi:MAG TPA: peptidoglycan DD-metalloendopeptidase family protein [Usitatibacter sp.]|nr:peptidoglycan DD-metalloendopeptidase family protein [Usitatibacter sp.]